MLPSFNEVSAALPRAAGEDAGGSSSEAPAVPIANVVPTAAVPVAAAEPKAVPVRQNYHSKGIPIYRIDAETGEVMKKFATMKEAATEYKIAQSGISMALKGLDYNEKSRLTHTKGHNNVKYQWAVVHPTEPFPRARSATPPPARSLDRADTGREG